MTIQEDRFPIVGIGASAGGIPALEAFFGGMPDNPGAAFVIVTHLSPERESQLHQIVKRYTDLPVMIAEEGATVERDVVYVMPARSYLTIKQGRLGLVRLNASVRERKPIDIFLTALAKDQREHAVAVVLSGGDGDGTLGAKAVKEQGGLTIAQATDGSAPEHPDMPLSAISSGLIDLAVSAEAMGEKIAAYARSFAALDKAGNPEGQMEDDLQESRTRICDILLERTGHDFSGYKTKTFLRRVTRRIQVHDLPSIDAYVDFLTDNHSEATALFRDLLINVTDFFRDADAFSALERTVIPKLFENRERTDHLRIWVPGCATGEEVYSLAILLREHMDHVQHPPRVQIFATDIDEHALAVARLGRYPEAQLDGVSENRKKRFFNFDGAAYTISSQVRELCVFSPHSVIRDPPFSRMDMVSCRNLLIYFGPEVQSRVLPVFRYALRPGGYLFLGTSESIGQHGELFATIDKKNRIFQARDSVGGAGRPSLFNADLPSGSGPRSAPAPVLHSRPTIKQAVEARVLDHFAPAHVVVSADGEAVYFSSRLGRFLEPPPGTPSRQILTMARKGLSLDLRGALREAAASDAKVVRDNAFLEEDDGSLQPVTLTVEPIDRQAAEERLFLIVFELGGPVRGPNEGRVHEERRDAVGDMEQELRDTRERLQSTIEEYETALEELKSSNEELVSVNEEAQSSNEELEASKEEMQSLNEELNTINAELTAKIEELNRANTDLKNLFESTRIATVFLDRNLVIRNFTPAASSFFNLRAVDVGRPLTDLASRLDYPELNAHISTAFDCGEMREHQLPRGSDGRHYLVRLVPYREDSGRTEGVIVTLVDVTTLAEAEEHQKTLVSELNHRVKNMLSVVISIANHTLERSKTSEDFNAALLGRLHAMARAYGLLSRTNWRDADLGELVRQEAEGFGIDRFTINGPDLRLKPQSGLSIGMVVHELATNASKYGALSKADGRVEIDWRAADKTLELDWRERDGPRVEGAGQDGFGLSLIRGEVEYRLGGAVDIRFEPTGLQVEIRLSLDD